MTTITQFNKHNGMELVNALRQALQNAANDFGVTIELGTPRYDENRLTFKVEAFVAGNGNQGESSAAIQFRAAATLLGLQPEDLGKTFQSRGDTYQIVGAKIANRKYPILAKNIKNGKTYKFTANDVRKLLIYQQEN